MCHFHLQRLEVDCLLQAFEDGTDTWFRNVGKLNIDAGEIPKRTYTIVTLRFALLNLYYWGKNSIKIRWAGSAECTEDTTDSYRVLAEIPDGKRPLRRPRSRWKSMIKINLQ
jgi:hypothetical protein